MVALNWTRRSPASVASRMMAEALFFRPTLHMPTESGTSRPALVICASVHG